VAGVYHSLKTRDSQFFANTQSCWYFKPSCVIYGPSPLLSGSTLSPFSVWKSILYTRIQCVRGDIGVLGLRLINICLKAPLQVNTFRWRHFAVAFYESSFYGGHYLLTAALDCRRQFCRRGYFSNKTNTYVLYCVLYFLYYKSVSLHFSRLQYCTARESLWIVMKVRHRFVLICRAKNESTSILYIL